MRLTSLFLLPICIVLFCSISCTENISPISGNRFFVSSGYLLHESTTISDSILVSVIPEDGLDSETVITVNNIEASVYLIANLSGHKHGIWDFGPLHKDSSFTLRIANSSDIFEEKIEFPSSINSVKCNLKSIPQTTSIFTDIHDSSAFIFTWNDNSHAGQHAYQFYIPGKTHSTDPTIIDSCTFTISRDSLSKMFPSDSIILFIANVNKRVSQSKNEKIVIEQTLLGPKYKSAIRIIN